MGAAPKNERKKLLLTGATGFVGMHLYPRLAKAGYEVICGTRHPIQAEKEDRARGGTKRFCHFDLAEPASVARALEGVDSAVYLVHSMADSAEYAQVEEREAPGLRGGGRGGRAAAGGLPGRHAAQGEAVQAPAEPAAHRRAAPERQGPHGRAPGDHDRRRRQRELPHGPRPGSAAALHAAAQLAVQRERACGHRGRLRGHRRRARAASAGERGLHGAGADAALGPGDPGAHRPAARPQAHPHQRAAGDAAPVELLDWGW